MRWTAITILFLAIASADYYPARFEEGYTFTATATSLYEAPDTASTVRVEVPPGELLEIESFAGVTMRIDSCDWGWYEASYRLGILEASGYVLDRDLAFAHVSLGTGEVDTLFFYRLTGFDPETHNFTGEAGVVADGEILARQEHPPCWTAWGRLFDYDVYAFLEDPSGLDGVKDLVVLVFEMPACGYENRDDLMVWTDDGRLVEGPKASSVSEAGVFHYRTEVVLPSDSGGAPDQVLLRNFGEEWIEELYDYVTTEEGIRVFTWTGDSFELTSESQEVYPLP